MWSCGELSAKSLEIGQNVALIPANNEKWAAQKQKASLDSSHPEVRLK